MKVVAIYTATVEVCVELGEFETWEEAAEAATRQSSPSPPTQVELRLEKIWEDRGDEVAYYCGHEVIGLCHFCGDGIADGCGVHGCKGENHKPGRGWTSTKHGHMIWCSVACRESDPEDPEHEIDP